MTVLWVCGEFAQEPGVLIISNPIKCETGGNGSTYGRTFRLASDPGLPFFFEMIYVLERGNGHFDLPSALPAEVCDVVPPTHELEARKERRQVHRCKSYHSLRLWGRRIRSTYTLIWIISRNAKTQPLKYVLEVGLRSRTILSNRGILFGLPQLHSAKKVPAEAVKVQGREREWQEDHCVWTHSTLDTQEVYFWSKNQTAELQCVKRKKEKYFVTTACSNNKQHMEEAVNFLQQENPTSKALSK